MADFKSSLEFTQALLLTRLHQLDREDSAHIGTLAQRSLVSRMACFSALIVDPVRADLTNFRVDDKIVDFFDVGVGSSAQVIAQGWHQTQSAGYTPEESVATIGNSHTLIRTMMHLPAPHTDAVQKKYGLRNDYACEDPTPLILPGTPGGALDFESEDKCKIKSSLCPFSGHMQVVFAKMLDTATTIGWLLPQEFETIGTES